MSDPVPEMYRAIAGGSVADAGGHVVILRPGLGDQLDARANAVAIALGPRRAISSQCPDLAAVHPNLRILAKRGHNDVNAPVAIQVAESAAAMAGRRGRVKPASAVSARHFPLAPDYENRVVLIHGWFRQRNGLDVSAADEHVFPSIVIEVVQAHPESRHITAQVTHAAWRRHLPKSPLPVF